MSVELEDNRLYVKTRVVAGGREYPNAVLLFWKGGSSNTYTFSGKRVSDWYLLKIFENEEHAKAYIAKLPFINDVAGGSWQLGSDYKKRHSFYKNPLMKKHLVADRHLAAFEKMVDAGDFVLDLDELVRNLKYKEKDPHLTYRMLSVESSMYIKNNYSQKLYEHIKEHSGANIPPFCIQDGMAGFFEYMSDEEIRKMSVEPGDFFFSKEDFGYTPFFEALHELAINHYGDLLPEDARLIEIVGSYFDYYLNNDSKDRYYYPALILSLPDRILEALRDKLIDFVNLEHVRKELLDRLNWKFREKREFLKGIEIDGQDVNETVRMKQREALLEMAVKSIYENVMELKVYRVLLVDLETRRQLFTEAAIESGLLNDGEKDLFSKIFTRVIEERDQGDELHVDEYTFYTEIKQDETEIETSLRWCLSNMSKASKNDNTKALLFQHIKDVANALNRFYERRAMFKERGASLFHEDVEEKLLSLIEKRLSSAPVDAHLFFSVFKRDGTSSRMMKNLRLIVASEIDDWVVDAMREDMPSVADEISSFKKEYTDYVSRVMNNAYAKFLTCKEWLTQKRPNPAKEMEAVNPSGLRTRVISLMR